MRKLCWFALGFVLAVLAMVLMLGGRFWWLGRIAVLLSVFAFLLRRPWARRAAITLLGLGFGMLWCGLYQGVFLRPLADVDGSVVPVEAVALEAPRETRYGGSVLVQMEHGGRRYRAVLYFQDQTVPARAGDHISCNAKLVRGEKRTTRIIPERASGLSGRCRGAWTVTKGEELPASWPGKLSAKLGETAARIFPADVAGFLRGLLLGARDGMDYAQRNRAVHRGHLSRGGRERDAREHPVRHDFDPLRREPAAGCGDWLPVVAFRGDDRRGGVQRQARCMLALLMLAPLADGRTTHRRRLRRCCFVLLVANPWAILDIGLQLSFRVDGGYFCCFRENLSVGPGRETVPGSFWGGTGTLMAAAGRCSRRFAVRWRRWYFRCR